MTERDLAVIERRAEDVRHAVNAESSPMGRLMAWGGAAQTIREDVPALVAEVRRLWAKTRPKTLLSEPENTHK